MKRFLGVSFIFISYPGKHGCFKKEAKEDDAFNLYQ